MAQEKESDLPSALGTVRRLLRLAPWQEEAHRQLMRILALDGQRSVALAQYDVLSQMLMDELGVPPAPETDALYDQILAGEVEPLSADGVDGRNRKLSSKRESPFQAPVPPSHFVGRQSEIDQICSQMLSLIHI